MSDRLVVVLAAGIVVGAWLARPVPPALLAGGFAVAVVVAVVAGVAARAGRPGPAGRAGSAAPSSAVLEGAEGRAGPSVADLAGRAGRAGAVVVLAAGLASCLGARAWSGVEDAPRSGRAEGWATLVTDPERVPGGVRAEVRLGGRRVQAVARGDAAGWLAPRLAGERVLVGGRLGPVTGRARAYLARRHVGARLHVDVVGGWSPGGPVSRLANQVRRTLAGGSGSLPPDQRALLAGLVLGDDRDQEPEQVDDFRAAGMTHLLAVSGQNVAFVLGMAAPLLRRLGLRGRLVTAWTVLVVFGVVTRWEPSVMRAVAMAALALLASTIGRPAGSARVLALAVAGLVLVDPMLAGSLGFLLSTAACAGIVVLGAPLGRRLPEALAVTLAAQAGVAPVIIPACGGLPVASLPAN
ncbi:MAG TPA: ComEC/Rec2 family competence protein, partial [Acidimicrobiales bacterium]|nr:ComEC/Rec2 family competence protein [Acidimicrobiales bacterium]